MTRKGSQVRVLYGPPLLSWENSSLSGSESVVARAPAARGWAQLPTSDSGPLGTHRRRYDACGLSCPSVRSPLSLSPFAPRRPRTPVDATDRYRRV